jgi:cytidine deaminase
MPIFEFDYEEYFDDQSLSELDYRLIMSAREISNQAYAPYSNFRVGAAVMMQNLEIVSGVNIENASYPVGICAERSALASAISQFPLQKIDAIAISYIAPLGDSNKPAFPCGMCRQFISECEDRNGQSIILFLAGQGGKIYKIKTAKNLLPFSFSGKDLK